MRKVEEVEVTRVVEQVTEVTCDFCGKEIEKYGHDGFTFSHRPGEEDEITIIAADFCDECFQDDEIHLRIQTLAAELRSIVPHARVVLGPAMGDDFLDEDLGNNE